MGKIGDAPHGRDLDGRRALEMRLRERTAALRESERRFNDILELSVDWVWETDREHRFTSIFGTNAPLEALRAGILDKTRWELADADPQTDPFWARHKADLDARRPFRGFRYAIERPEGGQIFVLASGKPLFDARRNFIGYRGTATNETAQAEASRRGAAAEWLLSEAIESIAGGVAIWDDEERLVLCNETYRGMCPDDGPWVTRAIGHEDAPWRGLLPGHYPDAAGHEEEWIADRRRPHASSEDSSELRLNDGRWMMSTKRRMRNGWTAALRIDITDLKQTQAAMLASEQRFRSVVEAVPTALVLVNDRGAIEMVNAQAEQIFGYARGELLGTSVDMLLPARDRKGHPALRGEYSAAPRPRQMGVGRELFAARKDGEEFPVEVGLSPLETDAGSMVLAAVIDISERKKVEQGLLEAQANSERALEALRRSEANLKRAQHIARMGSAFRNLLTDEAEWSDEVYRIFGVSSAEFSPTMENFLSLVHPEDRARVALEFEAVRRGVAGPDPQEFRIVRPDGSVRLLYREGELVRDDQGRSRYLTGIIQDITDMRAAQRREVELQQQLSQSQKMEAIGNLTGGMAHDFNNLLGVIIGNLDLVRDRLEEGSEGRGILDEALEAAWRGADLTRRLLAFARRQPLRPVSLDVNTLVGNTVRLLRRVLGEDIEISLGLAESIWPVVADPAQLEASLANLATNARDAMPNGGRLSIVTRNTRLDADYAASNPEVAAGEYVLLEVSDTGVGMPAEILKRVFEPFFTTKELGKGTGLGLSMVFGFLKQSKGHVGVYSEEGVGTTFRLYLPRALPEAAAPTAAPARAAERGVGERVLVVEDDLAVRRVVVRQLTELGYRVTAAERAAPALELLAREPVDLLFTDIVMPGGLDGVELARLARERWPGLKVLLTSGFPDVRTGERSLAEGLRLLSKPYSRDELAHALRAALAR